MGMRLERLTIRAYSDENYKEQAGEAFVVWMNPQSYQRKLEVNWADGKEINGPFSVPTFQKVGAETLAMKLIFDTTGLVPSPLGSDAMPANGVVELLEPLIDTIAKVSPKTNKPNFLQLSWAQLQARCVLTSMDIDYKLFRPDGTPIRAEASLLFHSHASSLTLSRTSATQPKDTTKLVTVVEGDTLPALCKRIYGNGEHYLDVAKYNGIFSFRNLKSGTQLSFPPLAELL